MFQHHTHIGAKFHCSNFPCLISIEVFAETQRFVNEFNIHVLSLLMWISNGVVVKLLACGARGPGFDSRSRRYDFRDLLSPASKSRYG